MQTSKLIPSKLTVVATIVFFLFLIIVQQSCKKTQNAFANEPIQDTAVGFFKLSPGTSSPVQKVARALQQQNNTKEFITAFAKNEGFAIWDKALVSVYKTAGAADTTVILPLVKKDSQYVQGFIYAKLKGAVNLYLYRNSDYRGLPYKSAATAAKSYTAEKFALPMMRLDRQVFGYTMFQVKDPLLFGDKRQKAGGGKITRMVYFVNDKKNTGTPNFIQTECVTVTTTSTYIASLHCTQTGKCSGGICDMCDLCVSYGTNTTSSTYCDSWDDGQGPFPQGGGGSTGGGGNPPCGPTPRPPYITTSLVPVKCDPVPNPWPTVPVYNPLQPFDNLDIPVNAPDKPLINNGITLSDTPHIFQTQRTPILLATTINRKNVEDMQYGTNGNASGITPTNLSRLGNADLITSMKGLFHVCTFFDNELKAVGDKMIQKFVDKTGGIFSDSVLNKKIDKSSDLKNFMIDFGGKLNEKLRQANGNINNVSFSTPLTNRPVFNGFYNKFHGLQILINDTEYTEIQLDNFEIGPRGAWAAEVTVTIHDHFGLDKNDALKYQGWSSGFSSWWILQHMRGLVPFETIVKVKKTIYGHL